MERRPLELSEFTVNLRKHVDPASPAPLRLMAAKALVPMAPQELALVSYQLSFDPDQRVKKAAEESLQNAPGQLIETAFSSPLPAVVLDWGAKLFAEVDEALEFIVTNKNTEDDTIALVAKTASTQTADLIADNQVRLLRMPRIIEALYMNPQARMSTVDKVVDLARRNGVTLDGLPALRPLMESSEQIVSRPASEADLDQADALFSEFLSQALAEEETELDGEDAEVLERSFKNRAQYLSSLRIPEKIRFAILGSREDRYHLVRDANRLVHMAAVSSPKSNEHDALNWSNNRSLPETVISYIANRRDWFRHYQVKVNLVNNPKLPLRIGIRILPHLHPRDLDKLSRNRNVSQQLARQAKALGTKRKMGRRG